MRRNLHRIFCLLLVLSMVLAQVLIPAPVHVHAESITISDSKTMDTVASSNVASSLATYIQDGCTLHCWNWSLANIKVNL